MNTIMTKMFRTAFSAQRFCGIYRSRIIKTATVRTALLSLVMLGITITSNAHAEQCAQFFYTACTDVAYGSRPEQRLDIHRPNGNGLYPVIIYVHGGSWTGGGRALNPNTDFTGVLRELYNNYAVVTIDYRLASVNDAAKMAPGALLDVKEAIKWVKANGTRYGAGNIGYGLDASRIVLWGHSAGGHLVTLAASTVGMAGTEPAANPTISSSVNGVFSFAGVYDFTLALPSDPATGASTYLGCLTPGAPALWLPSCTYAKLAQWSPVSYITSNDPRVLFVHNEDDPIVPFNQAQRYLFWIASANKGGLCSRATGGHFTFSGCNGEVDFSLLGTITPGARAR
jgi:acetyl esterase/lipase